MISYSRQQMLKEIEAGKAVRYSQGKVTLGPEDQIQADFFVWVDLYRSRYPALDLIYAIPNGANKSKMARFIFKLTGLRSGVPDVHLPVPRLAHDPVSILWAGLWIEFKSKTGTVTPNQKEWHAKLRAGHHRVDVCRTWQEGANAVIDYLDLPMPKL